MPVGELDSGFILKNEQDLACSQGPCLQDAGNYEKGCFVPLRYKLSLTLRQPGRALSWIIATGS